MIKQTVIVTVVFYSCLNEKTVDKPNLKGKVYN